MIANRMYEEEEEEVATVEKQVQVPKLEMTAAVIRLQLLVKV